MQYYRWKGNRVKTNKCPGHLGWLHAVPEFAITCYVFAEADKAGSETSKSDISCESPCIFWERRWLFPVSDWLEGLFWDPFEYLFFMEEKWINKFEPKRRPVDQIRLCIFHAENIISWLSRENKFHRPLWFIHLIILSVLFFSGSLCLCYIKYIDWYSPWRQCSKN